MGLETQRVQISDTLVGMSLEARRRELREFLGSRRARLQPPDVGLTPVGRRRVAGLRREEVAALAGVGVTWYSMLETGTAQGVSEEVISSVSRALRLTVAERDYLTALALGVSLTIESLAVDPIVLRALHGWIEAPAYVATRVWDVLAWNAAFAQVWAIEPPGSPPFNILLRHFVDPAVRAMHGNNWLTFARPLVAMVRTGLAKQLDDERYVALVESLREDPVFAELWNRHDIADPLQSTRGDIVSPNVGPFAYDILNLSIASSAQHTLIVQIPSEASAERVRARLREILQ